jgi:hypothetical protein
MSLQATLLPVFVQVALTFALLLWLARLRTSALSRNEVKERDIALGQKAWPEKLLKVGNSFQSQLELPVLFYVLVILAIIAHKDDLAFVILSWLFVAARLAHAYIHTGSNIVRIRGPVYGIGMLILIIMWVIFAVRVLAA